MYRTIISARAPSIISLFMLFRMQVNCNNSDDFGERLRAKKEKWVIVFDVNYSSVKCQSIVVHFAIGNLCSIVPARVEMEQVRAPNDLQKPSSKLITPRTCIFTSFLLLLARKTFKFFFLLLHLNEEEKRKNLTT